MKLHIVFVGWIFSAIFVITCCAAKNPLQGEYLSESYQKILIATKSPARAAKTPNPQSLAIKSTSSKSSLSTIYDFNESGPVFTLDPTGSLMVTVGYAKKSKFKGMDEKSFTLGYDEHGEQKFINIGEVQKFVRDICLTGKYVGTQGENVEFNSQGEFVLGGVKHPYKVGLYYPPTFNWDYFQLDSSEYGFKRMGDTLRIYSVNGGSLFEDGTMADQPTMILFRTQK